MRVHTGERPYSCDVCDKTFTRKHTLVGHTSIHTGVKKFSCDVCQRKFARRSYLSAHMRIHTGEKPFSCDVCQKSFISKIKHMRIHTGEKPFSCDVCQKTFHYQKTCKEHKKLHTGDVTVSCYVCRQKFTQQSLLDIHRRVHTDEKPFSCDVCLKSFRTKGTMSVHKGIHTRPFSCHVCKRRFSVKAQMTNHMRIHTDERPFSCDICLKTFTQKCLLSNHMRTHEIRKASVETCVNSEYLSAEKQHLSAGTVASAQVETMARMSSCNVCNLSFLLKSDLAVHMKIHMDSEILTCRICQKSFRTKGSLSCHMKLIHTSETERLREVDQPKKEIHRKTKHPVMNLSYSSMKGICFICSKVYSVMYLHDDILLCDQCEQSSINCSLCYKKISVSELSPHIGSHFAYSLIRVNIGYSCCHLIHRQKENEQLEKEMHKIAEHPKTNLSYSSMKRICFICSKVSSVMHLHLDILLCDQCERSFIICILCCKKISLSELSPHIGSHFAYSPIRVMSFDSGLSIVRNTVLYD